jgi:periplasmic divalent cation tolerance protein
MREFIQITTTTARKDEAQRLAEALVSRRLAACVQVIGPITSSYWWQGKIETAEEWQCVAKTERDRFDMLAATIRELHSYDTPEILAVPVVAGDAKYLAWMKEELNRGAGL